MVRARAKTLLFRPRYDERKEAEEKLNSLPINDQLTELPNRVTLRSDLSELLNPGIVLIVAVRIQLRCSILTAFKDINDTLGHSTGDQLLQEIGPTLDRNREG